MTQHLAFALQLALGATFALAATPKLRRPGLFARTVVDYRILPPAVARAAAPVLIAGECLLAVAFLTGTATRAALALAAVMLLVFGTATWVNLRRGRAVPCGCFGETDETISPRSLARLGLLATVLAALGALLATGAASATTLAQPDVEHVVAAAGTALFLALAGSYALHPRELAFVLGRLAPGRAR